MDVIRLASRWLQTSIPRPNARIRLFCIPHGGGGAQAYRELAQVLPDWVEVVAIQPPGRGPRLREDAISEMDKMRGEIVEAITPLLDRPYAVFGHSVGALIAFEVARELEMRNALAPLRVFLSAFASPADPSRATDLHKASDDELLSYLSGIGQDALGSEMPQDLKDMVLSAVRADFRLAAEHLAASLPKLQSPVALLGGEQDESVPVGALEGWQAYLASKPALRMFGGGHFYTETDLEDLAAYLEETLQSDLDRSPKSLLYGPREDYPLETCLHDHFRTQAAATPDRIALVDADGTSMTYGELYRQSDLLARRCLALGAGPDKLFAILMETSSDFVIAYLAILKSGSAYLPIPVATPDAAIADILAFAEPVGVITSKTQVSRLAEDWQDPDRTIVMASAWQQEVALQALGCLETAPKPTADNLAYCVMTSGTTGAPKGIVCPHRGAVNSYWWRYRNLPYGENEREACNVFFVWEVLRPLLTGQTAQIIADDVIFDPRQLIDLLKDRKSTRVLFTPSLLDQVLTAGGKDLAAQLPHLRSVILNGEVVTTALAQRFAEALPDVSLVNDYSISECHDVATLKVSAASKQLGPADRYLPVGQPMSNVNVYILDEDLQPVPWGATGDIYVGGESIARGYLKEPELTEDRFLSDPFANDAADGRPARMFKTGDVGRLTAGGELEISGRSQFMVKLRGYSVVPSAVEAEIRTLDGISAALVTTTNDPETGQPDHLVAYVVGKDARPPSATIQNLRQHLKQRLPHYAIPAVFEPMDALPIDPRTGKVDRKKLPTPQQQKEQSQESQSNPQARPDIETRLAAVWCRLLKLSTVQAGDNFFDLGGHSLLAAEVTRAIESEFGIDLAVIDVFDHPTLQGYAAHLTQRLEFRRDDKPFRMTAEPKRRANDCAIAVIGMAGRFPGADTVDELWQLVLQGRSTLRNFSEQELRTRGVPEALIKDPAYVKTGAVLEDVGNFDPRFWGISEAEATIMDPQQRLFLEACWHALEDAGHRPNDADGNIGVFAGCYLPGYLIHHLGAAKHFDPADPTRAHLSEVGNDKDYLASRVAYLMNLRGPAISVQTSCSTGLVAIAQAAAALRDGQCDMALAGASSITFPQGGFLPVDGHIGTRSGICRAFDAEADGTILGDGVGVVALRRLEDARADGDNVLAVIKGYAINNDGGSKAGYSAPSANGQAEVISKALEMADADPASIGYIEAHGTGTLLGDPIEVRGLSKVFSSRETNNKSPTSALGSIKPNIGHSNIAAGVAGFIKAAMAVKHKTIPPLANFQRENPALELHATPFCLPTETADWPPQMEGDVQTPRRAGVSSFGIGGTNCHVVIEEWQAPDGLVAPRTTARVKPNSEAPCILPLSAKTPGALANAGENLSSYLQAHPTTPLSDIAATLQIGREGFDKRLAVTASTHEEAARALMRGVQQLCEQTDQDTSGTSHRKGVVFVFPGHGAQYAGMASGLYASDANFRQHFDVTAASFGERIAEQLNRLVTGEPTGSTSADNDPVVLQPAIFTIEYALAQTLIGYGITPNAVCGHSLGEYAAAAVAGILTLEDGARLVTARARGTALAKPGAMLALQADRHRVDGFLSQHPELCLAGVNSPRDCVVSGSKGAIEQAKRDAERAGIAAFPIPVGYAFHSPYMTPAAEALEEACRGIVMRTPKIPMMANATGAWWSLKETADPTYWARAMRSPVLFADNIDALEDLHPAVFLEVGPGRSLQRALRSCTRDARRNDLHSARAPTNEANALPAVVSLLGDARAAPENEPAVFQKALAGLWQAGQDIDWSKLRGERPFQRVALPGYAFERHRCWPDEDLATSAKQEQTPTRQIETRVAWQDMFYLPSWSRTVAPTRAEPYQGRIVLLTPTHGPTGTFGDALASSIVHAGCQVTKLICGPDRTSYRKALNWLLPMLREDTPPLRVIDLSFLGIAEDFAPVGATAVLAKTFADLRAATLPHGLDYWLLTSGALQVATEPVDPKLAPLIGPLLVASQEDPRLQTRLIDIDLEGPADNNLTDTTETTLAKTIVEEVCAGHPRKEPLLALRGRHRWTERFEPMPLNDEARKAGCGILHATSFPHIVTGGLGRIGVALAQHLAQLGCHVVLSGRREEPSVDEWQRLFGAAGENIEYRRCNVADATAVLDLLSAVTTIHNGLGGIFHCAGLADLRYLNDTSFATIEAEAASKICGTNNLRSALAGLSSETGHRPQFVMLFSSLAAILGGLGMTGYTAANRYLDALVQSDPAPGGIRWVSVNFDDWDFDYTKEQVAAFAHTRQGLAMPVDDGLAAIEAILGEPSLDQVIMSATPLIPRVSRWLRRNCGNEDAPKTIAPYRDAIGTSGRITEKANDNSPTADLVLKAYAKVIGSHGLELEADFFELGGDSLLAAQLAMELRKTHLRGIDVSIGDIFDYPNPKQLAERLDRLSSTKPVPSSSADSQATQDNIIEQNLIRQEPAE
ncbi:MAG: SDR family NAD(P)-dependent oxidoreductase [Filomicrobium sp.]